MDGPADDRKTALEALGIDLCYQQTRANHFGALIPWLVALVFLAPAATPAFWGWAALLPAYVLGSFALHLAYLRRHPQGAALRRWGRYLVAHNVIMGLLTGLFPLLVDVGGHEALVYLVILLVAGPWFGAAVITAPHPPVFPAWIVAQPLILLAFLLRQGQPWVVVALVATALLASVVLWYHAARLNHRSAALRFDNLDLAERARAAARAKARFLTAVGHDLRQPLNALGLFQGALAAKLTTDDQRHLLGLAERARRELQGMLDDLAEQGREETGVVSVRRQAFALRPWLSALVEEVRPMATASGLTLRLHCPEGMTDSDPHLLRRLLRNLLVNAVRHTRTGGVLVGVRRRGGHWRITVWDTGPGIPTAARERIFRAFVRLREEGEGQGLGLSIVRQLAHTLGHPLHLHSREGRGSAFSVDVPRIEPAPGWVLLVDDDAEGREAVAAVLRQAGYAVVAMAAWAPLPARWPPPALVISDFHLPQGTGLEVVRAVRRHYGEVPALLVSGDAQAARTAGLPYLVKPVAAEALRAEVERLTAQ